MPCGRIGVKKLFLAAALLGTGLSLLYFTGSDFSYSVPLLLLAAPALLVARALTRRRGPERNLSLSLVLVSMTAALPLFYASALMLSDMLRSSGDVPPALRGIYNVFPGEFPYFLALILFSVFLSTMALFKAFEDVFESIVYIERPGILRLFSAGKVDRMEAVGMAAGVATALVSLKMGYSSVILLPLLFYSKVQLLLGAALTALIIDVGKIAVNLYAAAAATAVYYLVEHRLFSRYTGDAVAAVKKPMRMFYSSIALLIVLLVFFSVFQEKAPFLVVAYLVSLLPLLLAVPLTETGVLSLSVAAILMVSGRIMHGVDEVVGPLPGGWQLMAFFLASGILGAQVASYSTLLTSSEALEECRIGLLEAGVALFSVVIATWYYRVQPPAVQQPEVSQGFTYMGLLVPAVALAGSIAHMILFTPLVSEGAVFLGVNFMNPLGVFVGALFPSRIFAAVALSAIVLKLLDVRLGGRITSMMNGFVYGIGLGLVVSILLPRLPAL